MTTSVTDIATTLPRSAGVPAGGPCWYPTVNLFGLNVSSMDLPGTIRWLDENVLATTARISVFTANVDHVVRLSRDQAFRDCYRAAGLVTADGTPLVWTARLGGMEQQRVTGIDLALGLCELAATRGYPCFFLGARADVLTDAVTNLQRRYPGLQVAGMHDGYFSSDTEIISAINDSKAALLFVGMGSPKQEFWISRHFPQLHCRLALPIGGSFDVIAGRKRRAPVFVQKLGVEWAWRMCQEPRRLWRRYLLEDSRFLALALRELR